MNNGSFWQTTADGIIYSTPEGFVNGYYIYPPNYNKVSPTDKYELWLIQEDGTFKHDDIFQFDTLEHAKKYAIAQFKAIMKPFLRIL